MTRYPENPNDWTEDFIRELIDEKHEENAHLEYKPHLKIDGNDLEREFTAFANSRGGYIIFGVKDKPKISGLKNPGEEELTQYIKEKLSNTNPPVEFVVSDPIEIEGNTDRILLVVKVEESNKKPVSTKDSAYYIRMGESKQPIDREQLMTMFVDRERKQQSLRILEMEVNRFLRTYEEELQDPYYEGEPNFWKIDVEALRDAIRKNNHLYTDEETRKVVDNALQALTEIEDRERVYQNERAGRTDLNRSKKKMNRHYNKQLKNKAGLLEARLEDLKTEIT